MTSTLKPHFNPISGQTQRIIRNDENTFSRNHQFVDICLKFTNL